MTTNLRILQALAALLTCAIMTSPAWAEEPAPALVHTVSGKTVSLVTPEKTCAYNPAEKADAKILDGMSKADARSQLLLAFIDCNNLKAVRGAKNSVYGPGYYGQVVSSIAGQSAAENYTREAYIQAISGQYGKESPEQVMARGEQALKAALTTEDNIPTQTIGVIRRDKDFLQIAMLGSMQTPAGVVQKIMNVITITKLGVPVSIYLAHPANAEMTLQALSEHSELYARQLISLNPDEFSFIASLARGVDTASCLAGAIGGFLLGFIIAWLVKRRY